MKLKEIKFTSKSTSDELSENTIYKCNFCQKNVNIQKEKKQILDKLSGNGFYCSFCLSNNFQTKNNKNIIVLTFRSIFGFYYINLYKTQKLIYLSQINDCIEDHVKIGIQNPVFKYDPETMLWFIDFSRIGKGKKRISLKEVSETIKEIINKFEYCNQIQGYNQEKLMEKYDDALKKFYSDRYRPANRRILIPTMSGCVDNSDKISFEETKKFTKLLMIP